MKQLWQAIDGKIFEDESECEKYEGSLKILALADDGTALKPDELEAAYFVYLESKSQMETLVDDWGYDFPDEENSIEPFRPGWYVYIDGTHFPVAFWYVDKEGFYLIDEIKITLDDNHDAIHKEINKIFDQHNELRKIKS